MTSKSVILFPRVATDCLVALNALNLMVRQTGDASEQVANAPLTSHLSCRFATPVPDFLDACAYMGWFLGVK